MTSYNKIITGNKIIRHETIAQMIEGLIKKRNQSLLGITILEPDGRLGKVLREETRKRKMVLKTIDPTIKEAEYIINPLQGQFDDVTNRILNTFKYLYKKRYMTLTESEYEYLENIVGLVRSVKGNNTTFSEILELVRDKAVLEAEVNKQKDDLKSNKHIRYFKTKLKEKTYEESIKGIEIMLTDLIQDHMYKRYYNQKAGIDTIKSLVIGDLININTVSHKERVKGDVFGYLLLQTIKDSIKERKLREKVVPHYLIIEEAERYISYEELRELKELAKKENIHIVTGIEDSQFLMEQKTS